MFTTLSALLLATTLRSVITSSDSTTSSPTSGVNFFSDSLDTTSGTFFILPKAFIALLVPKPRLENPDDVPASCTPETAPAIIPVIISSLVSESISATDLPSQSDESSFWLICSTILSVVS